VVAALDTGLDFYRQVLGLRGQRQAVLSADIANASTPNFKAVDLDFKEALSAASGSAAASETSGVRPKLWQVSDARHLSPSTVAAANGTASAGSVKYLASTQVTLDGNSVDLDQVKSLAAGNAVDYEAAATFTSQSIKMLMTAINGSAAQSGSGA
jgi:flagellar basal-body rod protein FlgB